MKKVVSICRVQRRHFRPQGIAIPDEQVPPLEGTPDFDREVNDFYNLKLSQSFWRKELQGKFLPSEERENLRKRVVEKQKHFNYIRECAIQQDEETLSQEASKLLTKQYNEDPPSGCEFLKGSRVVPLSGIMKMQVATVLGFRSGLLWHQFDGYTNPIPIHPSNTTNWSLLGNCLPSSELPEGLEAAVVAENIAAPVSMPRKRVESENDIDDLANVGQTVCF